VSDTLTTLAGFAAGLASVVAIAGYHLLLPSPGVAFSSAGFAIDDKKPERPLNGLIKTLVDALRRSRNRHQIIETLLSLDDHLLRDVGLTRGIMVSITPADGRPRGLYADMIQHRLRQF